MREKRVWPPQRDADGESVAAFEAAVAVVKETVVRSGEVLVSAKEDLSDHQRWLKAQSEAVQADRERHERWLLRQRERQEALERREQKRAKRRAARQAALQSLEDAIVRVGVAIRAAVWSVFAKILGGFRQVGAAIAGVFASWWAQLRHMGAAMAGAFASSWAQLRQVFASVLAVSGHLLGSAGATSRAAMRSAKISIASAASNTGAKVQAVAASAGQFLSVAFGGLAPRTKDATRGLRSGGAPAVAWLSVRADAVASNIGETLGPAVRAVSVKAYALTPAVWDRLANTGLAAKTLAQPGIARLQGFLPSPQAAAAGSQNTLSWQGLRGFDLSQMLIIAGALLLVVGGLMLGGGLMLRAGTPASPVAETPAGESIAWLFEHKSFPLDERSIFAANRTPEGLRIKGFSIGAVNMADAPIENLEGVVKPDNHGEELKLDLIVVRPGVEAEAAAPVAEGDAKAPAVEAVAGTIPSQAPFKLVFHFPGAEGTSGMTPADVVKESGGILLKVRYQVAGKQRSFIQYLPASFLEEQLADLQAEAKGS